MSDSRIADRSAGASSDSVAVTLSNVTKRYGERVILDGISVTIPPGQTVALIGPSGGGKSTILRCINGLTGFDEGEIRVGSHVLHAADAGRAGSVMTPVNHAAALPLRRLFGMVFQDFQLFPHLTAIENIIEAPMQVLGLSQHEAIDRGMSLLKRVGLADRARFYPRQLSGGQKQRVAIARALAMQPRGLLCDEITSALDPELKHEVLEVLEDLRRDGLTLLVVTHEIGFARRAADRVLVLAEGRIVEEGPPAQVIDRPQLPRTQQFLRSVLG
jgi:ABC-type polar amino acid transport system ATPase subunit